MTGMWRGELCGLDWSHTDLDVPAVTITQTVSANGHEVSLGRVKTDRARRTIDIDMETAEVLSKHRLDQLEQQALMGEGWQNHAGLVFSPADGSM